MTDVEDLEKQIQRWAEQLGPAVVGLGRGWGMGSGVVVAPGRVLTTAHNLGRGHHHEDEIEVVFASERRAPGRVVGADPDLDLAVIDADTGEVEPAEWAPDGSAPLGRAIIALANPGGRGLHVTVGTVSSSARSFRGPRGRRITGAIEHTARLPRGSSGGPLIDFEGRLLGINAVRVDGGLILAVPVDGSVRERVEALSRGEPAARVRLGVAVAPPRVARRLRTAVGLPERDGVLVRAVEPESPADRAGIERGDLIVAAGGQPVERVDALYEVLDGASPGGELDFTVLRALEERQLSVRF
ncbi:MAG: S1C family serine protease [Solirubrobacteraceae bacterium]